MKKVIVLLLYMDCVFWSTPTPTSESWWTYQGMAGQHSWGSNPQWQMCLIGKRQSPINIETNKLLYDPNLTNIQINGPNVNGVLQNTGRSLEFKMNDNEQVVFSGGALSYKYQFEEINIHYGLLDPLGSEHQINGKYFSGEIQFYGYNKDLYRNISEAREKPRGIVVISVMVKVGDTVSRPELRVLTSALTRVAYEGSSHPISNLSITSLLPDTEEYLTYEGSLTRPGCWESVVWIIYNKPIYMTKQEMYAIRRLTQGTRENPATPIGDNFRELQPSIVTVRTNIKPKMGTTSYNCTYTYTDEKHENSQPEDLVFVKQQ